MCLTVMLSCDFTAIPHTYLPGWYPGWPPPASFALVLMAFSERFERDSICDKRVPPATWRLVHARPDTKDRKSARKGKGVWANRTLYYKTMQKTVVAMTTITPPAPFTTLSLPFHENLLRGFSAFRDDEVPCLYSSCFYLWLSYFIAPHHPHLLHLPLSSSHLISPRLSLLPIRDPADDELNLWRARAPLNVATFSVRVIDGGAISALLWQPSPRKQNRSLAVQQNRRESFFFFFSFLLLTLFLRSRWLKCLFQPIPVRRNKYVLIP